MKTAKHAWLLGLALIGTASSALAESVATTAVNGKLDPTQALIKGFAQYQADRVQSLVLDEFVTDLASEKIFQQFFPKTSGAVDGFSNMSGKRLIPLIQYYANEDIKTMQAIVDKVKADKSCLGPLLTALRAKDSIDQFKCDPSDSAKASRSQLNDDVKTFLQTNEISEEAPKLTSFGITDKVAIAAFDTESVERVFNSSVFGVATTKQPPKAVYVAKLMELLQSAGVENEEWLVDFNKLKSAGIFLASLSDASEKGDADAVRSAIADFVDEDQAYNNKRSQTGWFVHRTGRGNDRWFVLENSVFLASYFGVAVVDGADSEIGYRPFGPVGIEMTVMSFNGAPVGLNYSPIDIGAYVTYELKGEDYDPRVEDITAPSLFLSYSLRNKPVAFMAGYQWGLKSIEGGKENMAFISVAFDLPLFTLF